MLTLVRRSCVEANFATGGALRLALALSFFAAGAAFMIPTAALAASEEIKIKARYKAPSCPTGRPSMHALPHAKLAVSFGGRTIQRRLDGNGETRVELKGKGREMRAKVTFEGKLLEVVPYGKSKPYGYVDDVKLGKKDTYELEIAQPPEKAGAASAWAILARGAELAARSLPSGAKLPKATGRYDSGRGPGTGLPDLPFSESAYNSDTGEVLIDSRVRADEFEPWVLLHEYGHHVLRNVADPGPTAAGAHDLERSYPEQPAMAWSEGFAHAFAALALRNPILGTLCRTGVNLSTEPATPQSVDGPRYNQYHEISVAGVLWGLAERLGGPEAGFKALLGAFSRFNAAYGGPESLREARDALIEAGLEDTPEEHQAFTDLLSHQRMGWGIDLFVQIPFGEGGTHFAHQSQNLDIKLEGPAPYGGTCTSAGGGSPSEGPPDSLGGVYGASGALDYTWHDECYQGGFTFGSDQAVQIPYPAPSDRGTPEAPFTVSVRWYCDPVQPPPDDIEPCTSQTGSIRIKHGAFVTNGPQGIPDCHYYTSYCWQTEGAEHETTFSLPYDSWVRIVEFDALGRCKSLVDGFDCGR